jgi:hypothetical protein
MSTDDHVPSHEIIFREIDDELKRATIAFFRAHRKNEAEWRRLWMTTPVSKSH